MKRLMKPLFSVSVLTFTALLVSCVSPEGIPEADLGLPASEAIAKAQSICGQDEMDWLAEIIHKAEEDKNEMKHKGNYIGWISSTEFEGSTLFVVNMALGSGGLAFRLFDCNGDLVDYPSHAAEPPAFADPKGRGQIIYSTLRD